MKRVCFIKATKDLYGYFLLPLDHCQTAGHSLPLNLALVPLYFAQWLQCLPPEKIII